MIEENIAEYRKYIDTIDRPGIKELTEWLIQETDFFTAPAAARYHNNFYGGLWQHSHNVLKFAINIYKFSRKEYNLAEIPAESIILAALFHDLCKIRTYVKEAQYFKHGYDWIEYEAYKYQSDFPLGHGEKSLYYLTQFIKVSNDEALAIRHHMGLDGSKDNNEAMNNSLVRLISLADGCAVLVEKTVDYKAEKMKELGLVWKPVDYFYNYYRKI